MKTYPQSHDATIPDQAYRQTMKSFVLLNPADYLR